MIPYKAVKRKFRSSSNYIGFQARYMFDSLLRDLPVIEQHTLFFTPEWQADYLQKLEIARAIPTDQQYAALIMIKKQSVDNLTGQIVKMLAELYRYVGLAHDNKSDIASYKSSELYKVRSNAYKLLGLGERAHTLASETEEKALLIAAGYSQAKLDALETALGELQAAAEQRDKAEAERLRATTHRIESFNALWVKMQELSKGAKLAFAGNGTKQKQYLLYPKGSRPKKRKSKEVEIEDAAVSGD